MHMITKVKEEEDDIYRNFINRLDSEASRKTYRSSFYHFMKFCKTETYDAMLQIGYKKLEGLIRDFIIHMRKSIATIHIGQWISIHGYGKEPLPKLDARLVKDVIKAMD